MKRLIGLAISLCMVFTPVSYGEITSITEHKGLQRLAEDKIENNAHARFSNVYVTNESNVRVVKGRDKLNATANADTTVNMLCYYENSAGTTKKLVVKEVDEVVTYDTDGTSRTQITSGLTNEKADCTQTGDTFYFTSSTDGLYKWTGSGSATAVGSVSAPASVNFTSSADAGGLTSGLPAQVIHEVGSGVSVRYNWSGGVCTLRPIGVLDDAEDNTACGSLNTNFTKTCATSSTYKYKVVHYNTKWGIESEPSSADSVSLTGSNTVNVQGRDCFGIFSDSACTTQAGQFCGDTVITITGERTSTTGTLTTAPTGIFDSFRVYRTVASGSEYFLVGEQGTGAFPDGKPDVALGPTLDTTIDTIAPPSFRYIEEYKGTVFTAEGNELRFTRLPLEVNTDADTYWLETDLLTTGAKKSITGLHTASNSLLIFMPDRIQELTGFGVGSFRQRIIAEGIGSVSDESIETDSQGDVIFFAGVNGVYKLNTQLNPTDDLTGAVIDQPNTKFVRISSPFLDDVFQGLDSEIVLDPSTYANANAYYDEENDFYWLYVDDVAFLFNNQKAEWSYIPASKMTGSVYRRSPNELGQGVLVDDLGFIYNNWKGYENGIDNGTVTGTATSSSSTVLNDSTASYNTTGSGLTGIWVFIDNELGEYRQIQSNTATSITVSPAWGVNPTTTDDYYIGYVVADFKTKQYNFVNPPLRNKVDYIYLVHSKSDSSQDLELITYQEKSSTPNNLKAIDLSLKYVDKRSMPMGNGKYWYQWQGRSFVYNTSDTINPPVEIQSYAVDWQETEEF